MIPGASSNTTKSGMYSSCATPRSTRNAVPTAKVTMLTEPWCAAIDAASGFGNLPSPRSTG